MAKKCCQIKASIITFAHIGKDHQTAMFCHNLLNVGLSLKNTSPAGELTSEVLIKTAKDIHKCNIEDKTRFSWTNTRKGTF